MGDMGDIYRAMNDAKRDRKAVHGVDCPGCQIKQPRRTPTRLLPQQRCRVCGYTDSRPRLTDEQYTGADR